jgi:hypothetical protein
MTLDQGHDQGDVRYFLGSSVTILWNIVPIHELSEKLWFGQCQKPLWVWWPWPLTSDLGSKSWHFLGSSVKILWNIPIHAFNEKLWLRQCLNHYEHSDLDLWPITLNQGHDTFLRPGQQSCELLFKFIKRFKSYGPDKLFACVLKRLAAELFSSTAQDAIIYY